jgi:hypothetical protein
MTGGGRPAPPRALRRLSIATLLDLISISSGRAAPSYSGSIASLPEPQGDARDERLAQNEVLFRSVNESIEQQAIRSGGLESYEFICECASTGCFERVTLTLAQYESVRGDGSMFFVTPGHQYDEVELVVHKHLTHWLVQKDGPAAVVAELADPRDGDPV